MSKKLTKEDILKLKKPDEYEIIIQLGFKERYCWIEKSDFWFIDAPTKYQFYVSTYENDNFNDIIKDKNTFEEAIDDANKFVESEDFEEAFDDDMLIHDMDYEKFYSNKIVVYLEGNSDEIINFINNNDKLHDYKIILSQSSGMKININDDKLINDFISGIDYLDNIYVAGEGNVKEVCIGDYKKTMEYIDEIVNRVKKLNLSPMEQIMYVYDIVRDRKYKMESEDEDYTVSRDLTSVTQGDKIVCVGFAKIYDMVLQKLGIHSMVHLIDSKNDDEPGHARNMIYVKDRKYNIDGIYFFDPTFDSKRKDDDSHFDSYRFFARTYSDFYMSDHMNNKYMENLHSVAHKINDKKEDTITRREINLVNHLYEEMYHKSLLNPFQRISFDKEIADKLPFEMSYDKDKLYEDIMKFIKKFYKGINLEQFMKILTNVRIQEYYENSDKFPLSTEKIMEITDDYRGREMKKRMQFISALFGEPMDPIKTTLEENELDKNINRVRVAKTLRKVLEQKTK